jgi:hypothetical protein
LTSKQWSESLSLSPLGAVGADPKNMKPLDYAFKKGVSFTRKINTVKILRLAHGFCIPRRTSMVLHANLLVVKQLCPSGFLLIHAINMLT